MKHYMRGNIVTYSRGGTCVYVEIRGGRREMQTRERVLENGRGR